MSKREPVRIEGYALDDILQFPVEELLEYVEASTPIIVAVGSAEVLCEFRMQAGTLVAVLAHIDGGGDGVLRAAHRLLADTAYRMGCTDLKLIATAVNCAEPNLKLRRLLERLNFVVETIDEYGEAYVLNERVHSE